MASRDRLIRHTTPLLGEPPDAVFSCQNITGTVIGSLYLPGLISMVLFGAGLAVAPLLPLVLVVAAFVIHAAVLRARVVAVTAQRITVFSAFGLSPTRPRKEMAVLPRGMMLGPVADKKTFWGSIELGDDRWFVHRRYWDEFSTTDAGAIGHRNDR